MEREGARLSVHDRIGRAIARGADMQETAHATVAQTLAATAALERTLDEVRRGRARRAFGNGQSHAGDPEKAG